MKVIVAIALNALLFLTHAFGADSISYTVHLNGDQTPGKVDVLLSLHMDANENVNFDYILQAVKDVRMANDISDRLMVEKERPLKWIKTEMNLSTIDPPEAGTGYTYKYKINAFVDKPLMRGVTKRVSYMKCKDTLTGARGSRKWIFGCAVELDKRKGAEDGPEFFSAYSQPMLDTAQNPVNYCLEKGTAIDCQIHVTAVLKKIDVPFIAEVLFGTKDYSPGQAGHKFIESLLHGYFVLFELIKLPKPFEKQVRNSVTNFKASDRANDLKSWIDTYPRASADLFESR